MPFRSKKLAVLHLLALEAHPISLEELIKKLGEEYSERSVRRWLAQWIEERIVEKTGNGRSTKYQKIQSLVIESPCFSEESQKILAQVKCPIYERTPVAYNDSWIDAYEPNVNFYLSENLRQELHRLGKRSKREDPAGTYAHQIFNRLLIDLSYNSSRLEGNTYSLIDTQKLVLEGTSAEGKLDEEKIMILNHKEAIRYLVDHAKKIEINVQTICTLHYLLADGLVEPRYAGKLRDHGVRVGGSTYIPFEGIKELKKRLSIIAEKAASIHDPYEQSIFLLAHISYLQAFSDVNKRTARLSSNISLIKHNVVPLSFNDVDKDDYISSVIAIYELQQIQPLIDLYIFSYKRTCQMYDATIKTVGFDEIRVRYRDQRRALIREIILKKETGKRIRQMIIQEAEKLSDFDREAFIDDAFEDLKEIDVSRIAGMGITPEQLVDWQKIQKSTSP